MGEAARSEEGGSVTGDDHARRIAKNEVLFRDVNDRVKQIDVAHGIPAGESRWDFLCECSDPDCTKRVSLTPDAYEKVRSDPLRFVVLDGHENPDVERVVERSSGYLVIEKTQAQVVAARTNPRA